MNTRNSMIEDIIKYNKKYNNKTYTKNELLSKNNGEISKLWDDIRCFKEADEDLEDRNIEDCNEFYECLKF